MRITSLLLSDWRNFGRAELDLDSQFVVFWGPNGGGKTNLLEALGVLATLKSFRLAPWSEVIRWGSNSAVVGGRVEASTGGGWVRVQVEEGNRRAFLDGTPVKGLDRYFTTIRAVVFSPADTAIIRGSPEERRAFLDRAAFNAWPVHLEHARQLRRILSQKSALLRAALVSGQRRRAELQAWNERLVPASVHVCLGRRRLVEALRIPFLHVHGELSGGAAPGLRYRSQLGAGDADTMALRFRKALETAEDEEWRRGGCLVGPQRDDLDIRLWAGPGDSEASEAGLLGPDGQRHLDPRWRSARSYASQGQVRTLALGLKLAELAVAGGSGDPPVLLLDDLSSELDHQRTEKLVRLLESSGAQVILTTTDPTAVMRFKARPARAFHVADGAVASP
jgi:DNA replication and repair protein RecF